MSGFVGLLHSDGSDVDRNLLTQLTESMAYCGPDHRGTWVDGEIGLGHALLADRTNSDSDQLQPFGLDRGLWIAADARVDQPGDVARRLRARGRSVATDAPDALLILHAYEEWGEDCFDRFTGDFAVAIWDGTKRRLICARDRFGVIPMYYASKDQTLIVANVLHCMRLHPDVSDELDDRAIGDFLLFGRNLDLAATTYADIRQLPPGHMLTWDDGDVRIRAYWTPPAKTSEIRLKRPEEYVERFRLLFDQAVADRLRSSRVGTHLSGGMDSTSIAATAHHILRSRGDEFELRGFTMSYGGLVVEEEADYAKQVAVHVGIPIERLNLLDYLTQPPDPDPTWAFPEPGTIAAQAAEYELLRRVASFGDSLLAGLGGDPLLQGRPSRPTSVAQLLDRIRFAASSVSKGKVPRFGVRSALRRRLRRGWVYEEPRLEWIDPDFARHVDLVERWREVRSDSLAGGAYGLLLNAIWPALFAASHPGAHGVPVKVLFPFFDAELAGFVRAVPAFPWRQDKRLLREAMRDRLPAAILNRPKTPLTSEKSDVTDDPRYRFALLRGPRRWRRELMTTPDLCKYVDVGAALRLIESPPQGVTNNCFSNCFPLAHWLRSDIGRGPLLPRKETRDVAEFHS